MTPRRLVMLAGQHDSTNIVANELRKRFGDFPLIMEQGVPRLQIARRRAQKLGYINVAGQLLFMGTAAKWLRLQSKDRIEEIKRENRLDSTPVSSNVIRVSSPNSDESIRQLQAANPGLVVVNGTRILSRRLLASISGRFVNMHAGITPAFRGCHGAYWAMATGQPQLAGTTIHWIDAGIDTGSVLKQALIRYGPKDNFTTYPYLQLAAGLPLLVQTVQEFFNGKVMESQVSRREVTGSQLYYHPTLWAYLLGRLRGVK
jgi:folate-dependent phosphoribosylglycinamide formyltransferase PurN